MSDMYDSPEESPPSNAGSPELPDWAKQQVNQANREAQGLRDRLRERETELLTKMYEPVIDLLPEEVTSWDSKVAFLEKAKGRFDSTSATPDSPAPSSDEQPAPEADVPAETLAGIVNGPSHSAQPGSGTVSRTEWLAIGKRDPLEAQRLFQAGKVELSDLREGLGPEA